MEFFLHRHAISLCYSDRAGGRIKGDGIGAGGYGDIAHILCAEPVLVGYLAAAAVGHLKGYHIVSPIHDLGLGEGDSEDILAILLLHTVGGIFRRGIGSHSRQAPRR